MVSSIRSAAITASRFSSLLFLAALAFGCEQGSPAPQPKLAPAATVAGQRADLVDAEGQLTLRLRWRRLQTRLYGPDRQQVGAVVREGDALHLLRRDWQGGYILRPADASEDPKGTRRWEVLPAAAHEPPAVREGDANRLSRLEPDGAPSVLEITAHTDPQGVQTWRIRSKDAEVARLVRTADTPPAWTLAFPRLDDASPDAYTAHATGEGSARTVEVAHVGTDGDAAEVVVLTSRDERLTPGAAALALLPDTEPLLRGGLMVLLTEQL